ncbi:MAG: hypothetical protein LBP83_06760 [Dysgonamonadaceae bacterium]|nr:hypothetical protein [Dysgonamonadaceae bacterium]
MGTVADDDHLVERIQAFLHHDLQVEVVDKFHVLLCIANVRNCQSRYCGRFNGKFAVYICSRFLRIICLIDVLFAETVTWQKQIIRTVTTIRNNKQPNVFLI